MLPIDVFSTCPASNTCDPTPYFQKVVEVARWSEEAGCRGILVYTDNSLLDPWLVSQIVIEHTERLSPLVAVQPIYTHPYTTAKMITSLAYLYGRRVYLNMVAGGFRNDLIALNDMVPHDRRYKRLVEYTHIVIELLRGKGPVTFEGEFYTVSNLVLKPPLGEELFPGVFVSGSSEAGLQAARALGAVAVQYPGPPQECKAVVQDGAAYGLRVGIIAREDEDEAWEIAYERFPEDRKGQIIHQMAMKVSDSVWHKRLSGREDGGHRSTYWLGPFQNYKTFCPYLVGSYAKVAGELACYLKAGYRTYVLDIPCSEEELQHIALVFRQAAEGLQG